MAKSQHKKGVCTWCETKGWVMRDNGRCEDCDGNVFYCNVCEEDNHRDDLCRHIFQATNYEYHGAGLNHDPDECVEKSFVKLVGLMPQGFAQGLRTAILSGKFHTWMVSPLIGCGGMLTLYGTLGYGGRWGDDIIEIGGGDHAEETADGYHWLASLYDFKTPHANKITIGWLDTIIDGREVDAALLRLADDGCPHVRA